MPNSNNRFNEINNVISNHPNTLRRSDVINEHINEVRNEPRVITIQLDSLPAFVEVEGITYYIGFVQNPSYVVSNNFLYSYCNINDRAIEESEYDINEIINDQLSQNRHKHKGLKHKPQIMIDYYIKYIWYNKFIRIKSNKQKRNIYGCFPMNENDDDH